jgi:hypothetical protein
MLQWNVAERFARASPARGLRPASSALPIIMIAYTDRRWPRITFCIASTQLSFTPNLVPWMDGLKIVTPIAEAVPMLGAPVTPEATTPRSAPLLVIYASFTRFLALGFVSAG